MQTYYARQAGLLTREMDGEILLLDTASDRIHQLNRTASFVWQRCQVPTSPASIAADLVEAFEVDEPQALRDVREVLGQLQALNLVAEAEPPR